MCVGPRDVIPTSDGPTDLRGGSFPHLQRRLLTVPRCVGGADQIGGVLQGPLGEAGVQNTAGGGHRHGAETLL